MHKMKKLFLLMVLLTATLDSSAMQPANAQVKIGLFSSGLIPLLHYLCEHPEYDDIVLQHLHKTTQPSYGYFLAQGETTWPEYWTGDVPSKIHTCYTGVSRLIRTILERNNN